MSECDDFDRLCMRYARARKVIKTLKRVIQGHVSHANRQHQTIQDLKSQMAQREEEREGEKL